MNATCQHCGRQFLSVTQRGVNVQRGQHYRRVHGVSAVRPMTLVTHEKRVSEAQRVREALAADPIFATKNGKFNSAALLSHLMERKPRGREKQSLSQS